MPELPEIQAMAAFVESKARGRQIARIEMLSFAALKTVDPPISALVGRRIRACGRRGKFLLVETVEDEASDAGTTRTPLWLVVHFARAGWLHWRDASAAPRGRSGTGPARARQDSLSTVGASPELRAVPRAAATRPSMRGGPLAMRVTLDDGSGFDLTEAGTQKRLAVHLVRTPEAVESIARLGLEPLDPSFDAEALGRLLAGRTAQLKHLMADQSVIAGVGNAYSDEALHAARLSPFRPAGNLSVDEVARLHRALRDVLGEALVRNNGLPASSLKDEKRSAMRVHGRTGLPCPVCGDTVREVAFADRTLQYCPTCQTGGRPLADRRLSRLLR
ncbi:MAG: Fpg/Nei family DNA glycosylase [Candidatus Limnocylindrales bacterium]